MAVVEQALRRFGLERSATRVVIQGFGNVGGMAAKLMASAGFKIMAIVEWDGAVYNAKGLDIAGLMRHRKETGSILDFGGGENIDRDEAMFLETDVLIPAAKENVITSHNAHRLRTKILCEGANGPTTHFADPILAEKGIFIIPDILANAGGVTVSYFEWVQDLQANFWEEEEINERLKRKMTRAFREAYEQSQRHGVSMRKGAYCVAVNRVAEATKLRGLYP